MRSCRRVAASLAALTVLLVPLAQGNEGLSSGERDGAGWTIVLLDSEGGALSFEGAVHGTNLTAGHIKLFAHDGTPISGCTSSSDGSPARTRIMVRVGDQEASYGRTASEYDPSGSVCRMTFSDVAPGRYYVMVGAAGDVDSWSYAISAAPGTRVLGQTNGTKATAWKAADSEAIVGAEAQGLITATIGGKLAFDILDRPVGFFLKSPNQGELATPDGSVACPCSFGGLDGEARLPSGNYELTWQGPTSDFVGLVVPPSLVGLTFDVTPPTG